jgi:hypothetical protein
VLSVVTRAIPFTHYSLSQNPSSAPTAIQFVDPIVASITSLPTTSPTSEPWISPTTSGSDNTRLIAAGALSALLAFSVCLYFKRKQAYPPNNQGVELGNEEVELGLLPPASFLSDGVRLH